VWLLDEVLKQCCVVCWGREVYVVPLAALILDLHLVVIIMIISFIPQTKSVANGFYWLARESE